VELEYPHASELEIPEELFIRSTKAIAEFDEIQELLRKELKRAFPEPEFGKVPISIEITLK
jgi:hypothetical protein